MSGLPQVGGERLLRALLRAGFVEVRRHGSHAIVRHPTEPNRWATIPIHGGRTVRPGTLRSILRGARLTVDEVAALL